MDAHKIFRVLLVAFLLFTLLSDGPEASVRRRRRRRRNGTRRIRHADARRRQEFVLRRISAFRSRDRPQEGQIRLVDGREIWEGTVEIFHKGRWGAVCDDEWDVREGGVLCKELGFPGVKTVTFNGHYGQIRHEFWMDNLYCSGTEAHLKDCPFDGWGRHDCEPIEAAGVACQPSVTATTPQTPTTSEDIPVKDAPSPSKKEFVENTFQSKLKVRLAGGRVKEEGRVEVFLAAYPQWGLICGDDWSIFEAMVVCRQLGLKWAQSAHSTDFFGGNSSSVVLSGVKCTGNEATLDGCRHDQTEEVRCPGPNPSANIAGVSCVDKMADLVPDYLELERSTYLEDKQLFFLQCAVEENCLASTSNKQMQSSGSGWHLESRRLLRFTARIVNQGDEAFLPFLPKTHWQWHQCHRHYHSMEVFTHYDIVDGNGVNVAEGHKASFCLEDNSCAPGVTPVFKCANFGDQGISPGCTDTYAANIDCQWVDITDLLPGSYIFKLEINPEFKIAEQTFDNNAAVCDLIYNVQNSWLGNCRLTRPGKGQIYNLGTN